MNESGVRVVVVETFNSRANAETVARRAGGRAIVLPTEVNGMPEADSYQGLFEHIVRQLVDALDDGA